MSFDGLFSIASIYESFSNLSSEFSVVLGSLESKLLPNSLRVLLNLLHLDLKYEAFAYVVEPEDAKDLIETL